MERLNSHLFMCLVPFCGPLSVLFEWSALNCGFNWYLEISNSSETSFSVRNVSLCGNMTPPTFLWSQSNVESTSSGAAGASACIFFSASSRAFLISSGLAAPPAGASSSRPWFWSAITQQQRHVTLLVEENAQRKVVRTTDVDHIAFRSSTSDSPAYLYSTASEGGGVKIIASR